MKVGTSSDSSGATFGSGAVFSAFNRVGNSEGIQSRQESQDFKKSTALSSTDLSLAGSGMLVREGGRPLGTVRDDSLFGGIAEVGSGVSS